MADRTATPARTAPVTAIARVEDLPEWAREVITPYADTTKFNLLLPAVPQNSGLGYGHVAKVSVLRIDPNPANGDVYKVGSVKAGAGWEDRLALAKPALDKIGTAAGIQFDTARLDDGRDRDICGFQCRAAMKNESGQVVMKTYSKWINMKDVEDESRAQRVKANANSKYEKKTPEQLEEELQREMSQYRRHLAARCETGAILRAIRGQLGIRSQWAPADLAKPFVMMRVDFQPDASDPDVKRFLLEQGANASRALYGGGEHRPAKSGHVEIVPDDHQLDPEDLPGGGNGEPLPQEEMPAVSAPVDWMDKVLEACRALGVTSEERNALMLEHKGNMEAVYRALAKKADAA